ncbi:MAG: SDR family NAD(P)-dependent oxidoreductase [Acidobacteriota bacterium]
MTTSHHKTVLITGAAGGVGKAAAAAFHGRGYHLWLSDRNLDKLEALQATYPGTTIDGTDLGDRAALEELCRNIETSGVDLAVAFINAGVVIPGSIADQSRGAIAAHIDINLLAAAFLSQACARKMKAQGSGHIISTLSTAALISLPGSAAYSASKFGLRGFNMALAEDLAPFGVHVSSVYPNAIDTPMLRREAASGGSVLNFVSDPVSAEDVARVVVGAVEGRKREYFVPASDRFSARVLSAFPGLLKLLGGFMERQGRKGRDRYLRRHGLKLEPPSSDSEPHPARS